MPTIRDIATALTARAPLALQEDYDNCGLQIGDADAECTGVLIALDATPECIDEAVEEGCNLVVTHHPLLFKGLKHITGATRTERTVAKAIKNGVAVYSLHTAIDNAPGGVSHAMATRLGLEEVSTLDPMSGKLLKLATFIPDAHVEKVLDALYRAGAGEMQGYDRCSYSVKGQGTFRPLPGSHPHVGSHGNEHYESETRVEVILPSWKRAAVENALLASHPYEVPAYDFIRLENRSPEYGSGIIGTLPAELTAVELAERVKAAFVSPCVRCSCLPSTPVTRVALCGGSGSFLIPTAIAAGAQAIVTSDVSYHNFVDYAGRIFIVDIGHYESEECSKAIFYKVITEKFPNFAVKISRTETNPITYL